MANKNFNQFTNQGTLLGTDNLVGFRTTTPGGEFKAPVSSLLNYFDNNFSYKSWSVKAWVVATYRSNSEGLGDAAVLATPKILASYNISSLTGLSNTRFYITFPSGLFTSRRYCVIADASHNNNDKTWVAASNYKTIPSIEPLDINHLDPDGYDYKSTTICKFEASSAAYLTEFYIVFLGGDTSQDISFPI